MKKNILQERFQQLAGIKPLYEQSFDDRLKAAGGFSDEEFDDITSRDPGDPFPQDDIDYLDDWQGPPLREKLGLFLLILLHSPLVMYAPLFFITLIFCAVRYYKVHKYAHLNPLWGKIFLPWHYDHHMGKDQDTNWGVTIEWVDKLFGTRKKHIKTKKRN